MKILINIEPKYKVKSNSFVLTFFFCLRAEIFKYESN